MRSDFVTKAPPAQNVYGGVTTAQLFLLATALTSPSPTPPATPTYNPCALAVPGSKRFEQRKFGARASGLVSLAVNTTVTLQLLGNVTAIDPTNAANTILASSGAIALNAGTYPWWLEFDGIFDSVSTNLGGVQRAQMGNTPVAAAALANALTGLNGNTEPVFYIGIAATFSVANAASYAALQDFGIEG